MKTRPQKIFLQLLLVMFLYQSGHAQFGGGSGDGYSGTGNSYIYLDGTTPAIDAPAVISFTYCGAGEAIITLAPGTGGDVVRWYNEQFDAAPVFTGNTFTTPTLVSTTSYWVSTLNSGTSQESNRVKQTIDVFFADAGLDQVISEAESSVTLAANNPTGSGFWVLTEGSGSFLDDTDPGTDVTAISNTFNTYTWNLDGCTQGASQDDVVIIRVPDYNIFGGGDHDGYGRDSSFYTSLNGIAPAIEPPDTITFFLCGTGQAILSLTPGTGGDVVAWYNEQYGGSPIHSGNTFTTPLLETTTSFWVSSLDTVSSEESYRVRQVIHVALADAGPNQVISEADNSVTLAANSPTGSGFWELSSGSGSFVDYTLPNTDVVNISDLINVYTWNLEACDQGTSSDDVTVIRVPAYNIFNGGTDDGYFMDSINGISLNGEESQIVFVPGWNWFSVNRVNADMSLGSLLTCVTDGDYIKNQTQSAQYYAGFGWYGSLEDAGGLDPESLYKIKATVLCGVNYSGSPADASSTPIDLVPGWNWIGYLPQDSVPITDALQSLILEEGDYIKNQTESATFYAGFGWYGSLETLMPTDGYMINKQTADVLTYPETSAASRSAKKGTAGKKSAGISFDPHKFEHSGSVTARVYKDDILVGGENDLVLAFVDDEPRGIIGGIYFEPTQSYAYPMMVYSNLAEGETITFKYYEAETDRLYSCDETLTFEEDMIVASAIETFDLHVNSSTGLENPVGAGTPSLSVYPNPFNSILHVEFTIVERSKVRITVYDMLGKVIEHLDERTLDPGSYTINWNADNQPDGTYLLQLTTEDSSAMKRIILIR